MSSMIVLCTLIATLGFLAVLDRFRVPWKKSVWWLVWIDDDIEEDERGYILLHELHERNRMAAGWPYNKAHAESSRLESRCRHHPDLLHDALMAEGWG
jgi:hypothetical protein